MEKGGQRDRGTGLAVVPGATWRERDPVHKDCPDAGAGVYAGGSGGEAMPWISRVT